MAKIKGALNRRPSKQAIDNCWIVLRRAADNGDVNAAAKLIELDRQLGASRGRQEVHA